MIEIIGASKYYRRAVALNGIDLQIRRGEVIGLLGENGSGKTTLLKAIMGLVKLNSGFTALDGADIEGAVLNKLSFITEEGSCFPWLSVKEHAEFYQELLPRFDRARFEQLIAMFELPIMKKARALSRGMRNKLEIAIGFSRNADFVLMDEPFLGVDVFTRRDFIKLLIGSLNPEQCVVIATHQIQEIEPLLSRAVILKGGKLAADEDMENLREHGKPLLSLIKECYGYDDDRILTLFDVSD